jgi:lysine decarboxylase
MLADYLGDIALRRDFQTMIDGIDIGPDNALDKSLTLAAEAWGAKRTWFLTNGSSQGNITAGLAIAGLRGSLVAQRSVHSSVIDALALSGLEATFVAPDVDLELGISHTVTAARLDAVLTDNPPARAAMVVTPSYFGACADVAALADVAHSHNAALIVDEAWGAHLGFDPGLPMNAVRLGADLVIASMHKLGGSLGQTALLHLGHGPLAEELEPFVVKSLRTTASTSESTLLLASLDIARRQIAAHGHERIPQSLASAARLRERITSDGRFVDATERILSYPSVIDIDPLRIVIDTRSGGISGHEARHRLYAEHGHHLELSTDSVVVAIIGAGVALDADALADALLALPRTDSGQGDIIALPEAGPRRMTVREAYFAASEIIDSAAAIGRISADSVAAYPPGIPNLMPGEEITAENLDFLQKTAAAPFGHVRGALESDMSRVRVVRESS